MKLLFGAVMFWRRHGIFVRRPHEKSCWRVMDFFRRRQNKNFSAPSKNMETTFRRRHVLALSWNIFAAPSVVGAVSRQKTKEFKGGKTCFIFEANETKRKNTCECKKTKKMKQYKNIKQKAVFF